MADLTKEEFYQQYAELKPSLKSSIPYFSQKYNLGITKLPKSIEWETEDSNFKVFNKKTCNSDSIFAAVEALGASYFIKRSKRLKLSKQDLIDCLVNKNIKEK